jgi:hypothetical protein
MTAPEGQQKTLEIVFDVITYTKEFNLAKLDTCLRDGGIKGLFSVEH